VLLVQARQCSRQITNGERTAHVLDLSLCLRLSALGVAVLSVAARKLEASAGVLTQLCGW
jgi:hypothetical protein